MTQLSVPVARPAMGSDAGPPLLEAVGLTKHYKAQSGGLVRRTMTVPAVDGIDLRVGASQTIAIVGESGSGKTTLSRVLLMLERPTSGEVIFLGRHLEGLKTAALRDVRRQMQAVFQDPASSLNPRQRVWEIVAHPLRTHRIARGKQARRLADEMLELVELRPGDGDRLPHQLSLGQRQRVAIARALILRPALVIADEPVSALDVSVQAQILGLLQRLQGELGVSYVFISHDLRVVRQISHWVYIVYAGVVVEEGPVESVFSAPQHPYTQLLLASIPQIGRPPPSSSIVAEPAAADAVCAVGCRFQSRCPYAQDVCRAAEPALVGDDAGHANRCAIPPTLRTRSTMSRTERENAQ